MEALRLQAVEESLERFLQRGEEAAKNAGLSREAQLHVQLVLEEAVVNIIRHAYPQDAPGPVELACAQTADGRLQLTLTDWGEKFDPIAAPETDADLEAGLLANLEADLDHRALGGMGLFLIRSMAEATYHRRHDANELTLVFPPRREG